MSFPKTLYFCNKTLDNMETYSNNWKRLNPEYDIKLYDDEMCEQFLFNEYGQLYLDIFKFLKDGLIKADFWRLCVLYKYGGVYSDIDNEPFIPIHDFLEPNIDFLTCSSYWDSENINFNPNFIISHKENVILEKCINWYIDKYENHKKNNLPYQSFDSERRSLCYKWSIMRAFTDVLHLDNYHKKDGIYYLDNMKIQILKECPGNNHYDAHNVYKNMRVFNNRYTDWDCNTHSFITTLKDKDKEKEKEIQNADLTKYYFV